MILYFQRFFLRVIKKSSFLAITFLLLLTFLYYGCVGQAVVKPDAPSENIPAAISGTISENDVFSAIAQIDVMTPDGYYPVKAALIIKKPSYLRLELLPVIGTPDFFLVASPEKMSIFIPSKGKFYYGQPTGANLRKFLPWQFNIDDIVMIFAGTNPSLKEKNISFQSYREKNLLRIEMKAPSGCSQLVWVENNRVLKIVRNDENGKEAYTVKYIYDEAPRSSIPGKITISMADGITSLSIKFSDIKTEKVTDLSIFDLPVPANINAIPLD